jgi:hypothetical protein
MQLEEIAPQYDKLNPGIGFKHIEFSVNDKYIATYSGKSILISKFLIGIRDDPKRYLDLGCS